MEKGTSELDRQEYDQKILSSEQKLEQLSNEKRQIQELMYSLENELTHDFQQIQQLNDELINEGSVSARWMQEELTSKQRYFRQSMDEEQHELTQLYKQSEASEHEKRQALLKGSNDQVWD